jgi:hypothetical protein
MEHNPAGLVCGCKGFRHVGICSHVLVVNHWLDEIDLHQLMEILTRKSAREVAS